MKLTIREIIIPIMESKYKSTNWNKMMERMKEMKRENKKRPE